MIEFLSDHFNDLQLWLFESVVQPIVFGLGGGNLLEDAFDATGWLLVGLLQIFVILTVFRALERWRPVEPVTDPAAVRVDVIYTLIHRLGLFRLVIFFSIEPLWDWAAGQMRLAGISSTPCGRASPMWPGSAS
jgi:hypothetical protein